MKNLNEYFFGPLHSDWCLFFYVLTVLAFFIAIATVLTLLYRLTQKMDSANTVLIGGLVSYLISMTFIYIQNRILHGMCIKSLKA